MYLFFPVFTYQNLGFRPPSWLAIPQRPCRTCCCWTWRPSPSALRRRAAWWPPSSSGTPPSPPSRRRPSPPTAITSPLSPSRYTFWNTCPFYRNLIYCISRGWSFLCIGFVSKFRFEWKPDKNEKSFASASLFYRRNIYVFLKGRTIHSSTSTVLQFAVTTNH